MDIKSFQEVFDSLSKEDIIILFDELAKMIDDKEFEIELLEKSKAQVERGCELLEKRINTIEEALKKKDVEIARLSSLLPKFDLAAWLEDNRRTDLPFLKHPVLDGAVQFTKEESESPLFIFNLIEELNREGRDFEWKIYSNKKDLSELPNFFFLDSIKNDKLTGYLCDADKEVLLNQEECLIYKFEVANS